ncbi:MAG TPA: cysteine desulfurase [Myxococcales bacterium]|nr:cysteine desulfurase [Myxococcales bacterium]HIL01073.1 cysteine desulfurase [Myxococcales bacterium]
METFDVAAIRKDFPILEREVRGNPLVYLDTAASAQKPRAVLEAIQNFYQNGYANIHRGVYQLSAEATALYEGGRDDVQRFIGANDRREIVFVRNATEAINLVAHTWAEQNLEAGDEIVITALEHHANIVPWQMLGERRGTKLRVAPIDENGDVVVESFEALLGERTRLLALTHVSNAIGTLTPLKKLIDIAKARGITVLVDGAQAVPHTPVDVVALGCDFYVFSGHKLFGPTGIGVLYGRLPLLNAMPPFMGGGDMIETVSFERTTYAEAPQRFEAGTPDIAGVVGLSAAIRYVEGIGLKAIEAWEQTLLTYATRVLGGMDGLRIIGNARRKVGVVSFVLEGIHAHDVGTALDQTGIAVRVGHHCAQPLMEFFGVPATVRASFSLYNTPAEIDALAAALGETQELFS